MKTIIVVDDNEDLRTIVKRILDKEGFETILASDGDDCLAKIHDLGKNPDLILMDIMMPGRPVAEVLRDIGDVKVAYFSAVKISDKDKEIMMARKNVVDYIPKPFMREELVEKIKHLVGD
jgi:DNA-binding response OmpR family regulator